MRTVRLGALLVTLATVPAFATPQAWTGTISDSTCGAKHMEGEHGMKGTILGAISTGADLRLAHA